MMSWFGLVSLLFLISIPTSEAFFFRRSKGCKSKKTCVSCAGSQGGFFGKNCRWCPKDSKCYGNLDFFKNPCSRAQNIVKKSGCSAIIHVRYDRNLAYKMVFLSALAYANNVAKYIPKARAVRSFRLVKQVIRPCPGNARCSGFVAVSRSERAIAVAFRGSEHTSQVFTQAIKILTEPKVSFQGGGKVQAYFNNAFQLVWSKLKREVYNQIRRYPSYKVWVTGHSLGGALASLASTVIAYDGKTTKEKLLLYTFGQPRVGDYKYALAHDKLVPISFRLTHYRDPVVHLPTCNTIIPGTACLANGGPYHHGREIYYGKQLMTKYSSYKTCNGLPYNEDLRCSNNFSVWSKCFLSKSVLKKCINDHHYYFGVRVGSWWTSQ